MHQRPAGCTRPLDATAYERSLRHAVADGPLSKIKMPSFRSDVDSRRHHFHCERIRLSSCRPRSVGLSRVDDGRRAWAPSRAIQDHRDVDILTTLKSKWHAIMRHRKRGRRKAGQRQCNDNEWIGRLFSHLSERRSLLHCHFYLLASGLVARKLND